MREELFFRTVINQIWGYAEDQGVISEEQNISRTIKLKNKERKTKKTVGIIETKEETVKFINSMTGSCLFLPTFFAGAKGMRMSEIIALKNKKKRLPI